MHPLGDGFGIEGVCVRRNEIRVAGRHSVGLAGERGDAITPSQTLFDDERATPPPVFSGSLSFLLSQVGAHSAQLFAERLAPLGLTPRTYGVLSILVSDPGQKQQQLADKLAVSR